jgi:DinB superfamily
MNEQIELFNKHTTEFLDALALIPDRLRNESPDGEWSAAYIVHHTADIEVHFSARYLLALGADNPELIFFDENVYADRLHYEKRSLNKSLAAFVGIRAMMGETLANLDAESWDRTMNHSGGKTATLARLVSKADSHIVAHTEQMRELAAKLTQL